MSKIFKRPMFRRGGEVGGGIMSGIRQNYDNGGTARERLMKAFEEYPVQGVDPLSQFLIQGGLNLMSATPRGGVLATAAEAFKEPTAGLFKGLGTEQRAKREIALAGEQIDVESDLARQLAEIKNKTKDYFAAQTPEEQFEVLFKGYSESNIPPIKTGARNLAAFEVKAKELGKDYTQLGFKYDNKAKDYAPRWDAVPVGNITFNPMKNLAYQRINRDTDTAQDYIPLNPNTFQPLE
jgi:hypothetical protein